jgi:hypothetical protein
MECGELPPILWGDLSPSNQAVPPGLPRPPTTTSRPGSRSPFRTRGRSRTADCACRRTSKGRGLAIQADRPKRRSPNRPVEGVVFPRAEWELGAPPHPQVRGRGPVAHLPRVCGPQDAGPVERLANSPALRRTRACCGLQIRAPVAQRRGLDNRPAGCAPEWPGPGGDLCFKGPPAILPA